MPVAIPTRLGAGFTAGITDQSEIRLVHERGGVMLDRPAGALLCELRRRQPPQLAVNQRQQFLRRAALAALNLIQDVRDMIQQKTIVPVPTRSSRTICKWEYSSQGRFPVESPPCAAAGRMGRCSVGLARPPNLYGDAATWIVREFELIPLVLPIWSQQDVGFASQLDLSIDRS